MTPTPTKPNPPAAPPSDRVYVPILLALTAVTGIVDAVSFVGLGHVFTANMTGNVVFLAFAMAGASGLSAERSLLALAAFLVGGVLGGRMGKSMEGKPTARWISQALWLEGFLLATSAAVAYLATGKPITGPPALAIIVITGLAMGSRNATVRKLGIPDLTTTVLTLTITGLAADSSLASGTNPRFSRRLASVLVTFAGAVLGTWLLTASMGIVLLSATVVVAAAALWLASQRSPAA